MSDLFCNKLTKLKNTFILPVTLNHVRLTVMDEVKELIFTPILSANIHLYRTIECSWTVFISHLTRYLTLNKAVLIFFIFCQQFKILFTSFTLLLFQCFFMLDHLNGLFSLFNSFFHLFYSHWHYTGIILLNMSS